MKNGDRGETELKWAFSADAKIFGQQVSTTAPAHYKEYKTLVPQHWRVEAVVPEIQFLSKNACFGYSVALDRLTL